MSEDYMRALRDVTKLIEKMRKASIPVNYWSVKSLLGVLIQEEGSVKHLLWDANKGFYSSERGS